MIVILLLPFLALGCISFVLCALVPPARRFALSIALWFAASGGVLFGGVVAFYLLILGADALHSANKNFTFFADHAPLAWAKPVIALALIASLMAATAITLLHGWILRRVTFPLFRVYLSAVAFGVGLLTAVNFSFWVIGYFHLATIGELFLALPLTVLLAAALAWFCFLHAKEFRGPRPETLNPIAPTEYLPI